MEGYSLGKGCFLVLLYYYINCAIIERESKLRKANLIRHVQNLYEALNVHNKVELLICFLTNI